MIRLVLLLVQLIESYNPQEPDSLNKCRETTLKLFVVVVLTADQDIR